MKSISLLIVQITNHGSDVGFYLDGKLILCADPSCGDDTSTVRQVAAKTAQALEQELILTDYAPQEDWSWDDLDELVNKRDPALFANACRSIG